MIIQMEKKTEMETKLGRWALVYLSSQIFITMVDTEDKKFWSQYSSSSDRTKWDLSIGLRNFETSL